jgi:hypothetical protein
MAPKIVISPHTRALFALSKLSGPLQSDVLSDTELVKRWNIELHQPMKIADNLVFDRDVLFSAFRIAADGGSVSEFADVKGNSVAVTVTIDREGAACLVTEKHKLRFVHAVLMSSDRAKRTSAADQLLSKLVLTERDRKEIRLLVSLETFGAEDFLRVVEIVASSPEEFVERLRDKVNRRRVSVADILPSDRRHWEHLTAPRQTSDTLVSFLSGELAEERTLRIGRDLVAMFPSIALTFCSPSLVPHDLLAQCETEAKAQLLEAAVGLEDHFSLVGAFELCARWLPQDPRFAGLGQRLLDALFADMKRLEAACGLFAAAFILAVAKLSEDEKTRTLPAYWRRLAAASHASLVVRSIGVTEIKHEELFAWAMAQSGMEYFVSLLSDFDTDPQWRPEWIDPRYLLADVCGRAIGAAMKVPGDLLPESWKSPIDALNNWLRDQHLLHLTWYPALMEGTRRPKTPVLNEMGDVADVYRELINAPTLDKLLRARAAISTFGCPAEVVESLYKIIAHLRRSAPQTNDQILDALRLIAHVAVMLNDVALADAVAEASLERLSLDEDRQSVVETVHRLIECSAADVDRENAKVTIARRLEQLAFLVRDGALLTEVVAYIELLKTTDAGSSTRMGRALAMANLGISRSVA